MKSEVSSEAQVLAVGSAGISLEDKMDTGPRFSADASIRERAVRVDTASMIEPGFFSDKFTPAK